MKAGQSWSRQISVIAKYLLASCAHRTCQGDFGFNMHGGDASFMRRSVDPWFLQASVDRILLYDVLAQTLAATDVHFCKL